MLIEKLFLHVSDVASLLGCSSHTVYQLIKKQQLLAHKEGKAWKIYAEDVKRYIELLRRGQIHLFEQYDDLVTVDELTEMLAIGKSAAYRLVASGEMNCFRLNRKWKIPKQSVIAYVIEKANAKTKKKA